MTGGWSASSVILSGAKPRPFVILSGAERSEAQSKDLMPALDKLGMTVGLSSILHSTFYILHSPKPAKRSFPYFSTVMAQSGHMMAQKAQPMQFCGFTFSATK